MNINKFNKVVHSYKNCPNCSTSYKNNKMSVEVKDEVITISCECGFYKRVNEDGWDIKIQ